MLLNTMYIVAPRIPLVITVSQSLVIYMSFILKYIITEKIKNGILFLIYLTNSISFHTAIICVTVTLISAISVPMAAPIAPYCFIKRIFIIKFIKAPTNTDII